MNELIGFVNGNNVRQKVLSLFLKRRNGRKKNLKDS